MNRRHFLTGSAALAAAAALPFAAPAAQDVAQTVDCTADPYDLRPAVTAVLEAIAQQIKNLKPGQPLVVLLGENHTKPSNIALQYAVVDSLKKAGVKIACGAEVPYNYAGRFLEKFLETQLTPEQCAELAAADTDGTWSLATRMSAPATEMPAATSAQTLLSLYRRENISARFNDVARGGLGMLIDQSDPRIGAYIDRYKPEIKGQKTFLDEPAAVDLRNYFMADNIMAHIKQASTSLYIMPCGQNHVFGNTETGSTYAASLAALLKEKGAAILSVCNVNVGEARHFPPEAAEDMRKAIMVEGLATDSFMVSRDSESDVLRKLGAHSQYDIKVFDRKTDQQAVKDMLKRDAPAWIASVK